MLTLSWSTVLCCLTLVPGLFSLPSLDKLGTYCHLQAVSQNSHYCLEFHENASGVNYEVIVFRSHYS